MRFRTLGRSNIKVSEIGFGAWAIGGGWGPQDAQDSIAALHRALDLGVNFIDTAARYGDGTSERLIAQVLKDRSERVFVATKTPPLPGSWPPSPYDEIEDRYPAAYLRENVEERLRNLDTDCIDLLQLHVWSRAWNKNPSALDTLKALQAEGKIAAIGLSTSEHDQNAVIDLMRRGYLDTVQLIYNIFQQEPVTELLPVAQEMNVGVIVRVAFDEGVLTGKYSAESSFPEGDFRNRYFQGDRLARAVERVDRIKADIADTGLTMPQVALKFPLMHPAVSTVIAGIRNVYQAEANCAVSDLPPLSEATQLKLRKHAWRRAGWQGGK